jgi:hypothetical protein
MHVASLASAAVEVHAQCGRMLSLADTPPPPSDVPGAVLLQGAQVG